MFDVFLLFAVAGGLFEGFDDEGGGGRFDGDGGLPVLDREFDGYALWGGGYYAGVMGLGEGERRGIRVLSGISC